MAVVFSRSYGDEIADVTESVEYQTCEIRVDWDPDVLDVYDYQTGGMFQVTPEVNALALELIGFQAIIDDPNSTPLEVSDAENGFILASASLYVELGTSGVPAVIVSASAPPAAVGSLWIKPVDSYGVVQELAPSGWAPVPVDSTVYSGQARFIPVRASVWQGGEAQMNATTVRAVRFQVPRSARGTRFHAGAIVTITAAPFNANLEGRTAKVTDDFLGGTAATRTFHAMMDADSEDSDG